MTTIQNKKSNQFSGFYVTCCALLSFLLLSQFSFAAVPTTINYQGKLVSPIDGSPINDVVDISLSLYSEESGGVSLWTESHNVTIDGGLFSLRLGSITPLPTGIFSNPVWLGISVGADAEMNPRLSFDSAPYALVSESLVACDIGETNCGGACADLLSDIANCGLCSTQCVVGEVCLSGACGACNVEQTICDDSCSTLATDSQNCGACGNVCASSCVAGECVTDDDMDGFTSNVDCDDSNNSIFPGATEICNGLDNNCDGLPDDGAICDDANECTIDSCGASSGCIFTPDAGAPCTGGICDMSGSCVLDSCSDGVVNQDETDIDCGGLICGACGVGQTCALNSDCLSDTCTLNVCVTP